MSSDLIESYPGRKGPWAQTSLGGRFYPMDIRAEDIFISNLANGMALDIRYSGQGRVDRVYTVAEHCFHLSVYALIVLGDPMLAYAELLHDAAEGHLNDLSRSTKAAVGEGYTRLENELQTKIFCKYGLLGFVHLRHKQMKELDERIIPLEKAAIFRPEHQLPWKHDTLEPLESIVIRCWHPFQAKVQWLAMYQALCEELGFVPERTEI